MVDMRNRVRKALQIIVDNSDKKALNYAVNYTKHGIIMINRGDSDDDLKTQLLYVLSNITHWRGDDATVVRGILKQAIKDLN